MLLAIDKSGKRYKPQLGLHKRIEIFCPCCKSPVLAKCGSIKEWHFSHADRSECDSWAEMTPWHLHWQQRFPEDQQEIVMENHRADVVSTGGVVIEFQHSHLSLEKVIEREEFYQDMIWVVDGTEAVNQERLFRIETSNKSIKQFKWNRKRYIIDKDYGCCPMLLDIGNNKLIVINKFTQQGNLIKGKVISYDEFINIASTMTKKEAINHFSYATISVEEIAQINVKDFMGYVTVKYIMDKQHIEEVQKKLETSEPIEPITLIEDIKRIDRISHGSCFRFQADELIEIMIRVLSKKMKSINVLSKDFKENILAIFNILENLPSIDAQSYINEWSQTFMKRAETLASRDELQDAINTAKIVPSSADVYCTASEKILTWERLKSDHVYQKSKKEVEEYKQYKQEQQKKYRLKSESSQYKKEITSCMVNLGPIAVKVSNMEHLSPESRICKVLQDFWQQVLTRLPLPTQVLFSEHTILHSIDYDGIKITISSATTLLLLRKTKQPQVQNAFNDVLKSDLPVRINLSSNARNTIINEIISEKHRLNWTGQQGRDFILQRYGYEQTGQLTDENLLDYLTYLKKLCDDRLEQAILFLAGRCDGARLRDGQGFNGCDTGFGHWLADRISRKQPLLRKQAHAALKMIGKYRRQLENGGYSLPEWEAIESQYLKKYPPQKSDEFEDEKPEKRLEFGGETIGLLSPYDAGEVRKIKVLHTSRKPIYTNNGFKCWSFSLDAIEEVCQYGRDHGYWISPEVQELEQVVIWERQEKERLEQLLSRTRSEPKS